MDNFIEFANSEYNQGIELDEYNGEWSLVSARRGNDGEVYKEWCHPQRYDKETKTRGPIKKSVPWKIRIGGSEAEAIETLQAIIGMLVGGAGTPIDDDIPF